MDLVALLHDRVDDDDDVPLDQVVGAGDDPAGRHARIGLAAHRLSLPEMLGNAIFASSEAFSSRARQLRRFEDSGQRRGAPIDHWFEKEPNR